MENEKKRYVERTIVLLLFIGATLASIFIGSVTIHNAHKLKTYKKDYFCVNQIKYGFLNGENWSAQVEDIIEQKIDTFSLSRKNKDVMRAQVSRIMYRLLDQVDTMLHKKNEKMSDNIKAKVLRNLVDLDKVKLEVPKFANIVVDEIDKASNKDKVKDLVKSKLNELLTNEGLPRITEQDVLFKKYHVENLHDFNKTIKAECLKIEAKQQVRGYELISIMIFVLVLWIILLKTHFSRIYALAFMLSVIISFINLYIGINLPMLEIDARISELNINIMSSHVVFYEQILFYQSKSIFDVAFLLITKGKIDSIIVGVLVMMFSVFFPTMKLLCASIYLYSKKRTNQFVNVMAFKSGKWSMADVMVVAIFIAYIGFQSIINGQLETLAAQSDEQKAVNIFTTNRSNLQVGFIVFFAFVIFNLFLAMILKKIAPKPEIPRTMDRIKQRIDERRARRHPLAPSETASPDGKGK